MGLGGGGEGGDAVREGDKVESNKMREGRRLGRPQMYTTTTSINVMYTLPLFGGLSVFTQTLAQLLLIRQGMRR